jgi:hypothetical protein
VQRPDCVCGPCSPLSLCKGWCYAGGSPVAASVACVGPWGGVVEGLRCSAAMHPLQNSSPSPPQSPPTSSCDVGGLLAGLLQLMQPA